MRSSLVHRLKAFGSATMLAGVLVVLEFKSKDSAQASKSPRKRLIPRRAAGATRGYSERPAFSSP